MSEPRRRPLPWTGRASRTVSLAVVLLLATVGSFAAGFGVMTDCTSTYSCTAVSCRPCATTGTVLNAGWAAQGVLALVGIVVALTPGRGQPRGVRLVAVLLGPVSVVLFAVTTWLADRSS